MNGMAQIFGQDSGYLQYRQRKAKFIAKTISYIITIIFALITAAIIAGFQYELGLVHSIEVFFVGLSLIYLFRRFDYYRLTSRLFSIGSAGEAEALSVLSKLPNTYFIFRDIMLPGAKGNLDFVVSGPTGTFCIEVKNHTGRITFNGIDLQRNGYYFKHSFLGQARREAQNLQEYLRGMLGDERVVPVLFFTNPEAKLDLDRKSIKGVSIQNIETVNNFIVYHKTSHLDPEFVRLKLQPVLNK